MLFSKKTVKWAFRSAIVASVLIVLSLAVSELCPWSPHPRPMAQTASETTSPMSFRADFAIDRLVAQFFDGTALYATEHKYVYKSLDCGKTWEQLGHLGPAHPGTFQAVRAGIGRSETFRRLVRPKGIWGGLVLQSGSILVYCNPYIYRSTDGGHTYDQVHKLRTAPEVKAMLHAGWCEDGNGSVYYGEYGMENKAETHIMKSSDDGVTWAPVCTFPKGAVRHVHAVQYDPFDKLLWVATGDADMECMIAFSRDGGQTFTPIGSGDQVWRAVSLIFTPEYVYWGVDSPSNAGRIMRLRRSSHEVEKVADIEGPVYYSAQLRDGAMLMATTMEHLGTYGAQHAVVWCSRDGAAWHAVTQFDRPNQDYSVRPFGTIQFPRGAPLPTVVMSPLGVKGVDFATVVGHVGSTTEAPSLDAGHSR